TTSECALARALPVLRRRSLCRSGSGVMRGVYRATRPGSERVRSASIRLLTGIALCLVGPGSAFAIPSPELVVGSFTSISQLLALGSALLGGGALFAALRGRSRGVPRISRGLVTAAIATVVLLALSVGLNFYQFLSHRAERLARLEDTLLRQA